MLFIDKPHLQLFYNPVLSCTIHTWKGYFLEQEYREAMLECVELMNRTGAKNLIVNLQAAQQTYWLDDTWTSREWLPVLVQTDLQKLAIVVQETAFSSSFYFYTADSDRCIISCYFTRLEEALEWMSRKGL